mgnify:CR=1 FL=1
MVMQTDVKAKSVAGTGALGVGACRVKGIYFSMTTGGTVALTDGNNTLLSLTVPVGTVSILLPGEGIRFTGDPTVTYTTAVGALTVFYG